MQRALIPVILAALVAPSASGAVYLEIASVLAGPNGADSLDAVIGSPDTLGLYIWSDQPGATLLALRVDIVGTVWGSQSPDDTAYRFAGLGAFDPDGHFLFGDPGTLVGSSHIEGIDFFGDPAAGVTLPTSPGAALLIYSDLIGEAFTSGGGALPLLGGVIWLNNPQDFVTYGWYQSPSPGTLGVAGVGLIAVARRRR
jgi:hypothetical protein